MFRVKETKKLFYGKYHYKIVLICRGAYLFRLNNLVKTYNQLLNANLEEEDSSNFFFNYKPLSIRSQDELDYCFQLHNALSTMNDYSLRIEHPWMSIYSNNKEDIDKLADLDKLKIKYISIPITELEKDVIVMSDMPYDFRVTIGVTTRNLLSFVEWADNNKNIKLTYSCKEKLSRNRSYGQSYFYVKGEKNLLLAKMHLGRDINRIERIVNRNTIDL